MRSFARVLNSPLLPPDDPDNPAAGYALALVGAVAAMILAAAARHWGGLADLSAVFMLAVLAVASRTRTGPALATAVLCFVGYNFFFIEPHFTLSIASWQGVVTVTIFLAAAVLGGRLASQLAMQVAALRRSHDHAVARQHLSKRLADAASEPEAIQAGVDTLRNSLGAEAWIRLGERDRQQRDGAEEHGWWFEPLQAQDQALGVIGLKLPSHRGPLDPTQRTLVQAIGDDVGQTLLRLRLLAELDAVRLSGETQRLRNALLSSVSHDLRTPLASIIGAAGSLENYAGGMSEPERCELLTSIRLEGERLDRYIQNLLDMTRIEHGDLAIQREWIDAESLIHAAADRVRRQCPHTRITVLADPGLAAMWVQAELLEQALFNVLDNAARYSPAAEPIVVHARTDVSRELRIDVSDRGPGIPALERERVFDMFHRVDRGDRNRSGTGLGLAICRGVVAAHGGHVEADAGPGGVGTTIRLVLPHLAPPGDDE